MPDALMFFFFCEDKAAWPRHAGSVSGGRLEVNYEMDFLIDYVVFDGAVPENRWH